MSTASVDRRSPPPPLVVLLLPLVAVLLDRGRVASASVVGESLYTDRWAVRVRGGEDVARRLAAQHDFEFVAKVRPTPVANGLL